MEHILKKSIAIPALRLRDSLSGAKQSESAGENQTILEKNPGRAPGIGAPAAGI